MKYDAALLDFSLIDETKSIIQSINFALTSLNFEPKSDVTIVNTLNLPPRDIFYMHTGIKNEQLTNQFELFYRLKADNLMSGNTLLLPEMITVLVTLKANGIKTAIVSDNYRYKITDTLDIYNISHFVDCIVGYEDTKSQKPSPDSALKACALLETEPSRCIYVGDTLTDAETAQNAGMDFAALKPNEYSPIDFEAYPYKFIITKLSELCDNVIP